MVLKIDSNLTGLYYAEEQELKVLPVAPIWRPLEPNSFSDFGPQIETTARNPINASRQRQKGVVTDVDASGGFEQDLTFDNTTHLLQGFFFADAREKATTKHLTGVGDVTLTEVDGAAKVYEAASGLGVFKVGALVLASGFGVAANNGLKTVTAAVTGGVTVSETLVNEATLPAGAKLETVGFKFAAADVSISLNGDYVRLNSAAVTMTTLGLIPGEWVYLGGDLTANSFNNNRGLARINQIQAGFIEFDKTSWSGVTEAGTGKTVQIFFGTVIKNESDPALIKRRTYNLERTLGEDDIGPMAEYLIGAVANELTVNIQEADKVTIDISFVACDAEYRSGAEGLKTGTRLPLVASDAFNTSLDFKRIKLSAVSATDSSPDPLFAFATDMTLTVNNGITPNKAIGVLGAFDTTAGDFMVGGQITAYFASVEAVRAVRLNQSITLDIAMIKFNKGLLFDIPLLTLGDGRLNVEKDNPIMLPLENEAAESKFHHTLLFMSFSYLPTVAG